jgi:hypothetical protein
LKPNPVPLDGALRSERQILQHRKLNCPHYGACLDHSIAAAWESFSCTSCPLAAQVKGNDEHADALGDYATHRTGHRFLG